MVAVEAPDRESRLQHRVFLGEDRHALLYDMTPVSGPVDADILKGICQHIVFHDPLGISADDVPAATIEQIRADAIQQAKDTGKNEEIATKMAEGKVRKHLEENTLLHQKFILDESKQVKDLLPAGTTITAFIRYTLGG